MDSRNIVIESENEVYNDDIKSILDIARKRLHAKPDDDPKGYYSIMDEGVAKSLINKGVMVEKIDIQQYFIYI